MSTTHPDHSDHDHGHSRTNLDRKASPVNTKGLQEEYRVAVERRFRRLRGVLRETVDTNDALSLRAARSNAVDDIEPVEQFPFSQRAAKQAAFQTQLREWVEQGILERATDDVVANGEHWTATYVRAGVSEGIQYADRDLSGTGVSPSGGVEAALNAPIYESELEALYTRNFTNLKDITEDMDRALSRGLARGLAEGKNPRDIADELTKEVRTLQRTRARMLARTEIQVAHNRGALTRFRQDGIQRVEIIGSDPCPICTGFVGNRYPIDELPYGGPPWHPNCICSVSAIVT